jgi:ribokinase
VRVAVVGHVEWIEFARVERVPAAGEIVHAGEAWEEPGGGGAVAAVQLLKLAGDATLYTALGDDEIGHRAHEELAALGLRVEAVFRPERQRRAFVHLDEAGERTITVIGSRLGPRGDDPLPWQELRQTDAVYFTAGDPGAVHAARAARKLVATPRGLETLVAAGVELDALVASGSDRGERYERGDLKPPPRLVLRTAGAAGGTWESAAESGTWEATALPGPMRDAYGCGDSFAAGLTYGLGAGLEVSEAVRLGARCGAACLTGRGPYEGQLVLAGR